MGMKAIIHFEIPGNFTTGNDVKEIMDDLYKRIVEDRERHGVIWFKDENIIGAFEINIE